MNKVTTSTVREMKKNGEKIVMLTGYDCPMAKMLNDAGIDIILVGDSLGMVKLGFDSTLPVTLDDILYHCKSVRRGNTRAMHVADMPFMSYEVSVDEAIANAGKLIKLGGAEAVKIEGGTEIVGTVTALVNAKIPVMGHIGLTPQAINTLGGYRVQGKNAMAAQKLVDAAVALDAPPISHHFVAVGFALEPDVILRPGFHDYLGPLLVTPVPPHEQVVGQVRAGLMLIMQVAQGGEQLLALADLGHDF